MILEISHYHTFDVYIRAEIQFNTSLSHFAVILPGIVFLLLTSGIQAQFQDVSEQLGSIHTSSTSFNGNGLSFYDFNKDGWDDLSISKGNGNPLFFVNQGGTMVPASFSIPSNNQEIIMLLWADYDNDGDEDLLITKKDGPVELWNNDGFFNFTNVTAQAGFFPGNYNHNGAAFADYDHDGFLDLYVSKFYIDVFGEQQTEGKLYRNNGDGTFSDVTIMAGVHLTEMLQFQPVFFDYNKDGWEDLFIIVDRPVFRNYLFENNQDGTFTDVSDQTGMALYFEPMSASIADFDNDLDLDVYMTNSMNFGGNHLMVNDNNTGFSNQAAAYNVNMDHRSWGAVWLDYDNDSWLDLFVSLQEPFNPPYSGNEFYINQQGTGFVSGRQEVGLSNDFSSTYSCARGDLNNDGYFDFAFSNSPDYPFKLYQNVGGNNNYFSVCLEGTYSNKNGIGSWIHCYAGGKRYARYTLCGENLIGQNSGKEIFGLGDIEIVDSLVINWNRGTHEVYYDLPVNQHIHFVEGASLGTSVEISYTGSLFLCPGDSVVLEVGQFESYLWNTGETTQNITVFTPGEYSVLIENQFGVQVQSVSIEVFSAPEPDIDIIVTQPSCYANNDGSIELIFLIGEATEIVWSGGAFGSVLPEIEAGIYSFIGISSFGCAFYGNIEVQEPAQLLLNLEISPYINEQNQGFAIIEISGGIEPYSIVWSNGVENQLILSDLLPGVFWAMVTDASNCTQVVYFEIDTSVSSPVLTPPEFSIVPNPCSSSFVLKGCNSGPLKIELFNFRGISVFNAYACDNEEIVVDMLSPGLYILKLHTEPLSFYKLIKL